MALQNQTSKNANTFFFATKEAGEQDLFTSTITAGVFTDFVVGIDNGNAVTINSMPDIIGTSTTGGEEMLYAGTASTYKTLSTLSATATGICFSTDRVPGSGITTIESYKSNGATGGIEFLMRGVNSELLPAGGVFGGVLSTVGYAGAAMAIDMSGGILSPKMLTQELTTLNINSYVYPDSLIVVPAIADIPGAITVPEGVPTLLVSISSATTFKPGSFYQTDVNLGLTIAAPSSNESYLDLAVRLGGNGSFSYGNTTYVPGSGTAGKQVQFSLNQITDCGNSNQNIDVIAFVTNAGSNDLTITPAILSGGPDHFFKEIT